MAGDIARIFQPPTNIQGKPAVRRPIYILYPPGNCIVFKYQLFSINNTAENPTAKYETSAAMGEAGEGGTPGGERPCSS